MITQALTICLLTTTLLAQDQGLNVQTGLDVLVANKFAQVQGKKVGLVTNHTGLDQQGRSNVALFRQAKGVQLLALFSPEHGFAGKLEGQISEAQHHKSGLQIHNLYGENRKPSAQQLQGLGILVFDIQDIGCRYYTYISTMGLCMEAAAEQGLEFLVLDRPNPINGVDVAGPMRDADKQSFVAWHSLPIRHGMTVGELAQMFKAERKLNLNLQVLRLENWQRQDFWDHTGLPWVDPSPNMRSLNQALLYPGVAMLEFSNLSVGRGTDSPFEVFGSPWLDARAIARALNRAKIPGARFIPMRFTPSASKFAGQECQGIRILITQRQRFDPLLLGMQLAVQVRRLHSEVWEAETVNKLLCNDRVMQGILTGKDAKSLGQLWQKPLAEFIERRRPHLLYPESR